MSTMPLHLEAGYMYVRLCFRPRQLRKEHTPIPLSQLQPVTFTMQHMDRCLLIR
jgi:hypothetical protein